MSTPADNVPPVVTQISSLNSLPLGMIANTVEAFNGRDNVKLYFEKLEQRAKLDDWTETQTLKLFKYRLVSDGLKFLKSDETLDTLTYSEIKLKFIKHFSPLELPGEKLSKLNTAYQRHDENVASFSTRIKTLGSELLSEYLTTATDNEKAGIRKQNAMLMLSQFKNGLRKDLAKDIAIACIHEPNLTLERLIEIARITELNNTILKGRTAPVETMRVEFDDDRGRNQARTQKLCYRCHRPGHFIRECPEPDTRRKEGRWSTYNRNQPNRGTSPSRFERNDRRRNDGGDRRDRPSRDEVTRPPTPTSRSFHRGDDEEHLNW